MKLALSLLAVFAASAVLAKPQAKGLDTALVEKLLAKYEKKYLQPVQAPLEKRLDTVLLKKMLKTYKEKDLNTLPVPQVKKFSVKALDKLLLEDRALPEPTIYSSAKRAQAPTSRKSKKSLPSSCTPEYEALGGSTMCDFEDEPTASNQGVSTAEQQEIVDQHNQHRAEVSPTPSNMQLLIWDEEIAKVAQKYANVCVTTDMSHDTADQRRVPGYGIYIGQNLAWGYGSWASAIQGWYDEVKDWTYGQGQTGSGVIGHFTQIVNHKVSRIGCGYAYCTSHSYRHTYVCNYAFGNAESYAYPYTSGGECDACPGKCTDGLCDCGGLTCLNGGDIDITTCACSCPDPQYSGDSCEIDACDGKTCQNGGTMDVATCTCSCHSSYNGEVCENLDCSVDDPSYCGQAQPYGYPESFCTIYSNVPTECPQMCGLCDDDDSDEGSDSNGDADSSGDSDADSLFDTDADDTNDDGADSPSDGGADSPNDGGADDTCPKEYDESHCYSQWNPSYCVYSNVPGDCPYMCEVCTNPCPGIELTEDYCVNGSLNKETCQCQCDSGFTGTTCKVYETCPMASDWGFCGTYSVSDCDYYWNLVDFCPYLCGACV